MHILLLIHLLLSLGIFLLPKNPRKYNGFFLSVFQLGAFFFLLSKTPGIYEFTFEIQKIKWIPQIGLNLEFYTDGLSLAFALLVTGIGALVFLYAQAYMKGYPNNDRFYFYLLLFNGAMLGLVLSGNLIQMFIFWELTSYMSYILISYFHEKEAARKAAFQSLVVTGLGGMFMLAGIILLGTIPNSYSVADWVDQAAMIKAHPFYVPGLILILLGAFTKSAQFPFHFWLPAAMHAPTPVSAHLHSATMVKAGIFLLARLNPALAGTPEWTLIVSIVGVLTMLVGSYFAITKTELKSILAFTTISALGILTLLFGIDTKLSVKAAMLFLFVHAFYKATLFMIAGVIDKKAGTRELDKLGGLIRSMPFSFIIAALALLSMAGLPPMLGFLGKELIYEAKVQTPGVVSLILILGVTSNIFMVAVSLYLLFRVFLGPKGPFPGTPNEKGWQFLFGPGLLAFLSLFFGLFPYTLGSSIIEPALKLIRPDGIEVKLKVWHGFTRVFFLSLFTVVAGIILFLVLYYKKKVLETWRKINDRLFSLNFSDLFSTGLERFIAFSINHNRVIQHGYHRYYILTIFVFASAMLWFQVYVTRGWTLQTSLSFQPFYITGLALIIALSAIFSIISSSRIATIIAMGAVGYGISLIYVYFSAVDLAITQILAETLVVVMFVLILQRLPRFIKLSSMRTRLRDLAIALIFGSVMTVLALKAINVELHPPVSDYFIDRSYSEAFGKNVVNVILVDFRALDTLGEVTVLTVAALGVYALLRNKTVKR